MADIPPTRGSLLVRLRDPQDGDAWVQFLDLYGPLIYRFARKQGLQDADAADLSQEVLGTVAGAVCRLEYDPQRGAFRNWLFTIVRRKLSAWRSSPGRRLRGSGDSEMQRLLEEWPATEGEMESRWEREWEQRLFAWASAQIQQRVAKTTWQAFWRTAVEDQPCKQVAAELGLTVAAVYLARSRILAQLQQLIQSEQEA